MPRLFFELARRGYRRLVALSMDEPDIEDVVRRIYLDRSVLS
jgi:hypothetical protein